MRHKTTKVSVIEFNGKTGTIKELAEAFGVSHTCMRRRVYYKRNTIADITVGFRDVIRKPMKKREPKPPKVKPPRAPVSCTCIECGIVFASPRSMRICSDKCRRERQNRAAREKQARESQLKSKELIKKCVECGSAFTVPVSSAKASLCSDECRKARAKRSMSDYLAKISKAKKLIREEKKAKAKAIREENEKVKFQATARECEYCGNSFTANRPHSKYCSEKCSDKALKSRRNARKKAQRADARGCEYEIKTPGECAECSKPLPIPRAFTQKYCSKECSKKANKKRQFTKPHNKVRRALSLRVREILARKGLSKTDSVLKLVGCTTKQLKAFIEAKFDNRMNWGNYGVFGWHVDHIVPCAAFDLSIKEHQYLCFDKENLRPLWHDENIAKSNSVNDCDMESLDSKYLQRLVTAGVVEKCNDKWRVVRHASLQ